LACVPVFIVLSCVAACMYVLCPTLGVIGVGMWRSRGQVQILKIISNDFIRDTDYWENKAIVRALHEH